MIAAARFTDADLALRVALYADQDPRQRVTTTIGAIATLATATRSWEAFTPTRPAIDAALVQADAVARSLRELRAVLHAAGGASVQT